MGILGKKLEAMGAIALAAWYVAQAWGIVEDKRRAKKDDLKDRRIQELEAQVNILKLQTEKR